MGSPAAGWAAGLAATLAAGLAALLVEGLARGLAALGAGLAEDLAAPPPQKKKNNADFCPQYDVAIKKGEMANEACDLGRKSVTKQVVVLQIRDRHCNIDL